MGNHAQWIKQDSNQEENRHPDNNTQPTTASEDEMTTVLNTNGKPVHDWAKPIFSRKTNRKNSVLRWSETGLGGYQLRKLRKQGCTVKTAKTGKHLSLGSVAFIEFYFMAVYESLQTATLLSLRSLRSLRSIFSFPVFQFYQRVCSFFSFRIIRVKNTNPWLTS